MSKLEFNLDFDYIEEDLIIQKLKMIKENRGSLFHTIAYRSSCGGKGYHAHIIMIIKGLQYYLHKDRDKFFFILGLRLGLGDDYKRIITDIIRYDINKPTDRLFYYKNGKFAGNWINLKGNYHG